MKITFLKYFFCFIIFTLISSCTNEESKSTYYIGAYRGVDRYIPYPYILNFKEGEVELWNSVGIQSKISCNSDSIIGLSELDFGNHAFKIQGVNHEKLIIYDKNDQKNFRRGKGGEVHWKEYAKFIKIEDAPTYNIDTVRNILEDKIWKTLQTQDEHTNPNRDLLITQSTLFNNGILTKLKEYSYEDELIISEVDTIGYRLFEIEGIPFLGTQKEADNPLPIFQIVAIDDTELIIKDYSNREVKEIIFSANDAAIDFYKKVSESNKYENCFEGYQGEYYYDNDVTYQKGNEYLQHLFTKELPNSNENGYLIVHYDINCYSELGNFGLIQMNNEFEAKAFPKEVVNHIITTISTLKDWPSSESTFEWLHFRDVHGFLMVKFSNGKIIDVCP